MRTTVVLLILLAAPMVGVPGPATAPEAGVWGRVQGLFADWGLADVLPPEVPDQPVAPTVDAGVGARPPIGPACLFAAFAFAVSFDPAAPALVNVRSEVLEPQDPIPCEGGADSWLGHVSADVLPGTEFFGACLGPPPGGGLWVVGVGQPCHFGDFRSVSLAGRVGVLDRVVDTPEGPFRATILVGGTTDRPVAAATLG